MKAFIVFVALTFTLSLWAGTPELGDASFSAAQLECPEGRTCSVLGQSFCSRGNTIITPRADDSFDILFIDFYVSTNRDDDYGTASCLLELPIVVPLGKQINLKEVSVSGVTDIPEGGQSTASITHFFGGRESTRKETYTSTTPIDVTHQQELSDEFSDCGTGNAVVETRVDITTSRASGQFKDTYVDLSRGAGKLVYQLEYRDCVPPPVVCNDDQFKYEGVCYNIGNACSDYHGTNKPVCRNGYDDISCKWDIRRDLCHSKCKSYQFSENGVCYDKASSCFEYDGTDSQVCNNGSDDLQCDWVLSSNECVSNCPQGTFERDGVCYEKNGNCSQYNGTNSKTCNTDKDNLSCDWIPENFGDLMLINTCVAECPSGAFEIDGQCYRKNGSCSQYNGTDSDTCNNGQDNLRCDWNSKTEICYAEN